MTSNDEDNYGMTITITFINMANAIPLPSDKTAGMITIELSREQLEYGFMATDASHHSVMMDTSPETGGKNFGFRPMQLMLAALAGCSAIDVISILNKQRQLITDYKMKVHGDRQAGIEPSLWQTVDIEFYLFGNIDETKARRAADLSIEKYCSVAATLRAAGAKISWKVFVNKAVEATV